MKKLSPSTQKYIFFLKSLYQSSKGYTFILALALGLTLHSLLVAYAVVIRVESISTKGSADSNNGFYGAEAGLNRRAEEIRKTFVDFNRPSGSSPSSVANCLDSDSSNDGTGDFGCQQYEFVAASESKDGHLAATYVVERNGGRPKVGVVPRGEAYQNLNMLEYSYSVYSIAKRENAPPSEVTAILQLDVKSRLVPMFQFAAFYANDLEILPGPIMDLNGPIHTNGNLYLGANENKGLNIDGQITLSGNLYNSRKNDNSTYPDGRVTIINAAGTSFLNLLSKGTGRTNQTKNPMDPILVSTAWGTQVQLGMESISLPPPSFLEKSGEYYEKANLRFSYKPVATSNSDPDLTTVPFEVTTVNQVSGNAVSLTEGELRSLRQPILVSEELADISDNDFKVCNPVSNSLNLSIPDLNPTGNTELTEQLPELLYIALVSQTTPITYSSLSQPLSSGNFSEVRTSLLDLINSKFSLSLSSLPSDIINKTPNQIAGIDNRCFVSAVVQDIGRDSGSHQSTHRFYNDREGRDMRLLQLNFQSLAIWNKVGRYVEFTNGTLTDNEENEGFSAEEKLFNLASPDSDAPEGSFQNLGLGANDETDGGLVIYATIDGGTYSKARGNTSPYGFAITQGQQLMSLTKSDSQRHGLGVTFATDQAVYLQGDYNIFNKQAAAILTDSINVLSNACLNADKAIHKHSDKNCNTDNDEGKKDATSTTVNTAFLSGTDITNSKLTSAYNGGLENYPRFSENWAEKTLTYRGSFVSLGIPEHVKGRWKRQRYNAPKRNWDYDLDLNDADNLPPLTPRFVYLRQESFIRNFQQ
ncbi:hypothetical protein [Crocosphaera watsonii]|uniref:Uncharacterized protein n=2 Tax=Crocosphaera watsonii TaxID=263511 RepID=T2JUH4_CROWT|nr:hypothetical protein [Crocosphaera watsonii]CCQ56473.1 hypothetical protein CWATWH0005_5751 [Crocosphaera watsonii WH 0005]CCQ68835.1 hypothetical protein CWATWH0402_5992 [Crocosphaera watsonii WH 0402]